MGSFAFWDSIHPTATVHAAWGLGFEQLLAGSAGNETASPVPEPATAALLLAGLLGTLGARKIGSRAR